jgi:pimeloyl-ACP methyl ester carboxylesterase
MPFALVNGTRLYYESRGVGEPVVFIAGLMGGVQNWCLQVDGLSASFRCISLDNRGFGQSDKSDEAYSISMFAGDVTALLDHLHLEQCHVVGSSMGGMIAQQFAVDHPHRVRTLSLHCTAPRSDAYIQRVSEVYTQLSYRFDVIDRFWVDILCFSHDTYNARKDEIGAVEEGMQADPMPAHTFRRQLHALAHHDLEDRLGDIDHPTLIGCGSDDVWMPPSAANRMHELIPGSRLEIFDGMGHLYKWEDPERFNRVQSTFLKAHAASPG